MPQYPQDAPRADASDAWVVGTWNIESLHDGQFRGFPEFFDGGPLYGPRDDEDYAALASAIRAELGTDILVLQEVGARESTVGAAPLRSVELDRLCRLLGASYEYVVGRSGGGRRVAVLWDGRRARLDTAFEVVIPRLVVDGRDVFERDPLVARFTLMDGGAPGPAIAVVGVHLASGACRTRNHDRALGLLADTLAAIARVPGGPLGGAGLLLAGDFNLDYLDACPEEVLRGLAQGAWRVLAGPGYPPTRLGGVPLAPVRPLDYLVCADVPCGPGWPVGLSRATVHGELARSGYDAYRRVFSDHFPVTAEVRSPGKGAPPRTAGPREVRRRPRVPASSPGGP